VDAVSGTVNFGLYWMWPLGHSPLLLAATRWGLRLTLSKVSDARLADFGVPTTGRVAIRLGAGLFKKLLGDRQVPYITCGVAPWSLPRASHEVVAFRHDLHSRRFPNSTRKRHQHRALVPARQRVQQ
jgi:hypothetical protein